jgi:hypothetical protein
MSKSDLHQFFSERLHSGNDEMSLQRTIMGRKVDHTKNAQYSADAGHCFVISFSEHKQMVRQFIPDPIILHSVRFIIAMSLQISDINDR